MTNHKLPTPTQAADVILAHIEPVLDRERQAVMIGRRDTADLRFDELNSTATQWPKQYGAGIITP